MRVVLIGATGQVGWELQQVLASRFTLFSLSRQILDLFYLEHLHSTITPLSPDLVINAAAYTAVDQAEHESELAKVVNGEAPGKLAEVCQKSGSALIHISTDYVFGGQQSSPYCEEDATNPLGVYGRSKLLGEKAVRENCDRHIILRTAWVYGNHGKSNFVKTMLRLGAEREEIQVVADQVGSPTWARDIAQTIAQLSSQLRPEIYGTYHYTNSGVASWYDFAVAIFEEARQLGFPLKVRQVVPITTAEYSTLAQRPAYSVLACAKISKVLGTFPPHWRQSLREMLAELYAETYESTDPLRR